MVQVLLYKPCMKNKKPIKSDDVPATKAMLQELENKLIAVIKSEIYSVNVMFELQNAKFEKIFAELHRIGLLVEEQNARNKYVLDGYAQIFARMDKIEKEST